MTQEDFQARIARLNAAARVPGAVPVDRSSPERPDDAPSWHFYFGLAWGVLLGNLARFLNENFELLFTTSTEMFGWGLAGASFLVVSLAALAIMLVSGLFYALVGRFGRRRWSVLLGALIGFGVGSFVARVLLGVPLFGG